MRKRMNNRFLKPWRKLRDRRGMMIAELLIVVAIIAVLSGVAFIGVTRYQRSLGQLERDEIAKQIFVAAQNHLTATKGTTYSALGGKETDDSGEANGNYYLVHNRGDTVDAGSILRDMLPLGSIDETIRTGGNYVIRYHRQSNTVLDVFYCSSTGSPQQFNYSFFADGDSYPNVVRMADPAMKSERKTYVNNSILGWYGGEAAETLQYVELDPPEIEVVNAERLYVKITYPNPTNSNLSDADKARICLRLLVTGKSSNVSHYINVVREGTQPYTVVLDDITDKNLHFCNRKYDDTDTSNGFIPGENITIQALVDGTVDASSKTVFVPAYSASVTTNSLFANAVETNHVLDTAYISNIRHLENLDKAVSLLDANDTVEDPVGFPQGKLNIATAIQTSNLNWKTDDSGYWTSKTITSAGSKSLADGYSSSYYPVSPDYKLAYDGSNHSISDVTTSAVNAGLFGTLADGSVSNLELIDFTVTGTNAGALAGTTNTATVTNVLARSSGSATATNISATGSAGGLIGSMTGGSVTHSAAALIVSGNTAGGLIGTASGTVTGCYSGGHTVNGAYDANHYNVTATGIAGGLIGSFTGTKIENSYSTCSVQATDTASGTAGGLVGTATLPQNDKITNCYCTGLVSGKAEGAFAGSLTGSVQDCQYFSIINERQDAAGNFTYLKAFGGDTDPAGITAFDESAASYDGFVGAPTAWTPAMPYDDTLLLYYGKYNLPSITRLGASLPASTFASTHYGDWPAPEIFTINN